MPRQDDQDAEDGLDDPEAPDPSDTDPDYDTFWEGDTSTTDCPYCRKQIAEESEWCPHCGKFISREDAPSRKSVWIVVGIVLLVLIVLAWQL